MLSCSHRRPEAARGCRLAVHGSGGAGGVFLAGFVISSVGLLIGGIGPRIQDVLNSLGIYHYDQIAEWTLENIAWIDEYLNFHGRVKREGWVEQAAVLVGEGAEP